MPGHLSYVTGMAGADAMGGRVRTVLGRALFMLGFSALFAAYGAAFGGLSAVLPAYQDVATRVLGVLTVLLGLLFMGCWTGFSWLGAIRVRANEPVPVRNTYQPRVV
ncbi:hypothetical protein [Nonomuraea sp. 10N515B]|uniref:hypothetical protein n=1 Tax=Nonomuraea sp. 10N515B TaxID=3457422 RepID=UPI003FCCC8FA